MTPLVAPKRNIKKIESVEIPNNETPASPGMYNELRVNHQIQLSQLMKKMKDYVDNSNSKFRFQESQIQSL